MENDMTRASRKPVLTETLSSSDDLITPKEMVVYKRAIRLWGDIATTQAGEYAVIAAAQANEESAKNFILYKLLTSELVKSVLWKFLGPNPTFQKLRIANGDTGIYKSLVAEAMGLILERWDLDQRWFTNSAGKFKMMPKAEHDAIRDSSGEADDPVLLAAAVAEYAKHGWKPVARGPKNSIFANFFFQVASRIKNITSKYNTEQNRGGISGKILAGEKPETESYEARTTDETGKSNEKNDMASHHDPYRGTDELNAWESFIEDKGLDKGGSPTPREVLKYMLSIDAAKFDAKEAGRKLGTTHVTIYSRLKDAAPILERYGLDFTSMASLLQIHGQGLGGTL